MAGPAGMVFFPLILGDVATKLQLTLGLGYGKLNKIKMKRPLLFYAADQCQRLAA